MATINGIFSEFSRKISASALKASAGTYAKSVISGGSIAGKSSRWGMRGADRMMGGAFGGGMAGHSGIMNRGSMLRAAGINAGVGGILGGASDGDDRMGGAMRGAALGAGMGYGARMGLAGARRYAAGNPEFRSGLNSLHGRYSGARSRLRGLGNLGQ